MLPISAKTGIGSFRSLAKFKRDLPAFKLPVKPTAFTKGLLIKSIPVCIPPLLIFEKTPSGIFVILTAFIIAEDINSPVPACIG